MAGEGGGGGLGGLGGVVTAITSIVKSSKAQRAETKARKQYQRNRAAAEAAARTLGHTLGSPPLSRRTHFVARTPAGRPEPMVTGGEEAATHSLPVVSPLLRQQMIRVLYPGVPATTAPRATTTDYVRAAAKGVSYATQLADLVLYFKRAFGKQPSIDSTGGFDVPYNFNPTVGTMGAGFSGGDIFSGLGALGSGIGAVINAIRQPSGMPGGAMFAPAVAAGAGAIARRAAPYIIGAAGAGLADYFSGPSGNRIERSGFVDSVMLWRSDITAARRVDRVQRRVRKLTRRIGAGCRSGGR